MEVDSGANDVSLMLEETQYLIDSYFPLLGGCYVYCILILC